MRFVTKPVTPTERQAGIIAKEFHDHKCKKKCVWLCNVEWSKVEVDKTYQRNLGDNHVKALLHSPAIHVPPPSLSLRQGVLYVDDGQHRIETFKEQGQTEGFAWVLFDMKLQDSAKQFTGLNTNKRQDSWQKFRSNLAYGNPTEVAISQNAKKYHLTMVTDDNVSKPDLRNAHVLYEAKGEKGCLDSLLFLLSCLKREGIFFNKGVRTLEFQRGLVDVLGFGGAKLTKSKLRVIGKAIIRLGYDGIMDTANNICDCSRTNRGHIREAIITLLRGRGEWVN